MFEILGIVGIAISAAAYVPQMIHLAREHCSAGVSSRAWAMWLAGGLLVGLLAVQRGDPVFILLQLSSLTSAAVILVLARRYKGMACETHVHAVPGDQATVTALTRRGMPLRDIADAVGLSHQRVHQIVGDGSLRGRVGRKVAKHARAGGAVVIVLFLVIGSWIAGTAHPQSRAADEADITEAREFLETKLPEGAGESLSQKLDTLFNDGQR